MLALASRWIGGIGTIIGLISYIQAVSSLSSTVRFLLYTTIAIVAIILLVDTSQYFRHQPRRFRRNSKGIAGYLCGWLQSGGRAVVFSRDLSWAEAGSQAEKILRQKADRQELVVFAGRRTSLLDDLASRGSDVHIYDRLTFTPEARFTLNRPWKNRDSHGDWHPIQE